MYLALELIKMHLRQPAGGRSTDPSDYPPHKAPYALRDVDSLIRRGREQGSAVGAFCEQLLGGALPWTKIRQGLRSTAATAITWPTGRDRACRVPMLKTTEPAASCGTLWAEG